MRWSLVYAVATWIPHLFMHTSSLSVDRGHIRDLPPRPGDTSHELVRVFENALGSSLLAQLDNEAEAYAQWGYKNVLAHNK